MSFVVQYGVPDLGVVKVTIKIGVSLGVSQLDDSREKAGIHHHSLSLGSLGGLREPELVQQVVVDQLSPIYLLILHC